MTEPKLTEDEIADRLYRIRQANPNDNAVEQLQARDLARMIAAAEQAARAEAWDEGARAMYLFERGATYPEPTNPYWSTP